MRATRPTMRFVAIKSPGQQPILALHRTRDLLVGQRTQLVNMIRAQLAEFGVVLPKGIQHALKLVDRLLDGAAEAAHSDGPGQCGISIGCELLHIQILRTLIRFTALGLYGEPRDRHRPCIK